MPRGRMKLTPRIPFSNINFAFSPAAVHDESPEYET